MKATILSVLAALVSLCSISFAGSGLAQKPQLPLIFEPNAGQTAAPVRYMARSREGSVFFTSEGITVAAPQTGSFRLTFANSLPETEITPEDLLSSHSNYPAKSADQSISNVANYGSLRYRHVYPGIDVRFYGNAQHLEHDLLVAPGADLKQFVLQLEGISALQLAKDGSAEFRLGDVPMHESAPVAWQTVAGRRIPISVRWELERGNHLRIAVGD